MRYLVSVLLSFFLFFSFAHANQKSTELVVTYPTGGATDIFARHFQKYLINSNVQTVVVNKPGADGKIGVHYVLSKPADSNTVMIAATGPILFNKVFYNNNGYDYSQFDMVVPIVRIPLGIAVSNQSGIKSLQDLIEQSKLRKLNCGSSNSGSSFAGRFFIKRLELTKAEIIPYKGSNEVANSLIGGNIDCAVDSLASLAWAHRENKIRLIAIGGQSKHSEFTDIPILKSVIKDFEFYYWYGIAVLKGHQVDPRIFELAHNAFKDPGFIAGMKSMDVEIVKPPADSQKWLDNEYQKFESMRQQVGLDKVSN